MYSSKLILLISLKFSLQKLKLCFICTISYLFIFLLSLLWFLKVTEADVIQKDSGDNESKVEASIGANDVEKVDSVSLVTLFNLSLK